MRRQFWLILTCVTLFLGCTETTENPNEFVGLWRMELRIEGENKDIPFFLEFISRNDSLIAAVWNGDECIIHSEVRINDDSVHIKSPVFNTEMHLKHNQNILTGYWKDYSRGNQYVLPLSGKYNLNQRFKFSDFPSTEADGIWEVHFSPETEESYPALGLFKTEQHSMQGTFLTETGDYRFLDGGFASDSLKLSAFDGSHAFLFEAEMNDDTLRGWFYSGSHWKEPFIAWRNDSFELRDPYELSELTNPDTVVDFAFKDLDGKFVQLSDSEYINKPVLVQITGSWCPNCMDETKFLVTASDWLEEQGVSVVALAFERGPYDQVAGPLKRMHLNLKIPYPYLYAGTANKDSAQKSFPFLKQIKSYPTLLYLNREHKVVKIHTGFYGPGTKSFFERQSLEFKQNVEELVAE